MLRDFKSFLLKQNVIALAIAVIIGAALGAVVKSMVDDLIMPIVGVMTPSGNWQAATLHLGPAELLVGRFAAAVLNFIIVGLVIWRLSKIFIKPEVAPATITCPACRMLIDPAATRCPHCTSAVGAAAAAGR
jgi:large conductance mechanosensitive channel